MSRRRQQLLRGVCRVVGHRWVWRLTEDDWPYHECTRCAATWMLGRPVGPSADQSPAS
jgi:hypothetical protein